MSVLFRQTSENSTVKQVVNKDDSPLSAKQSRLKIFLFLRLSNFLPHLVIPWCSLHCTSFGKTHVLFGLIARHGRTNQNEVQLMLCD